MSRNPSKADIMAAVQNLIKAGHVVARKDDHGRTVYLSVEDAPSADEPLRRGPLNRQPGSEASRRRDGHSRK